MFMFENKFHQKVFVKEMIDPTSEKHYRLQIHMTCANCGVTDGWVCTESFLSDFDPNHNVMVGILNQAFLPEDIVSEQDMLNHLEEKVFKLLPTKVEQFEKMVAVPIE